MINCEINTAERSRRRDGDSAARLGNLESSGFSSGQLWWNSEVKIQTRVGYLINSSFKAGTTLTHLTHSKNPVESVFLCLAEGMTTSCCFF